jgi:hypothetical protein
MKTELVVLRRGWRRWVAIIELFARRRRARHRVDLQAYGALHKELIAACRSLADSAEGTARDFYQGLEDLTRPWWTPRVLAKADREILVDLLIRCRQAERELGGRVWVATARRRSIPVLASSAAVAAVVLLTWTAGRRWSPVLDRVQSWSDFVWYSIKHSSEIERLFVISLIVAGASAYVVSRAARE